MAIKLMIRETNNRQSILIVSNGFSGTSGSPSTLHSVRERSREKRETKKEEKKTFLLKNQQICNLCTTFVESLVNKRD